MGWGGGCLAYKEGKERTEKWTGTNSQPTLKGMLRDLEAGISKRRDHNPGRSKVIHSGQTSYITRRTPSKTKMQGPLLQIFKNSKIVTEKQN